MQVFDKPRRRSQYYKDIWYGNPLYPILFDIFHTSIFVKLIPVGDPVRNDNVEMQQIPPIELSKLPSPIKQCDWFTILISWHSKDSG